MHISLFLCEHRAFVSWTRHRHGTLGVLGVDGRKKKRDVKNTHTHTLQPMLRMYQAPDNVQESVEVIDDLDRVPSPCFTGRI